MDDSLLEVDSLELKLNLHWVLKDVSFHVREREIVAILGENGSGKTMTLSQLLPLRKARIPENDGERKPGDGKIPLSRRDEQGFRGCL